MSDCPWMLTIALRAISTPLWRHLIRHTELHSGGSAALPRIIVSIGGEDSRRF